MSRNTLLDDEKVLRAEDISTFKFNDRGNLRPTLRLDENKYPALLGDSVLKLVLILEGSSRKATPGAANAVISEKASNAFLAQRGFATGLAECVYKNRAQGNTVFPGPMASTVQAIIGAVFIDSGKNIMAVEGVMEALGISWPE